MSYEVRQIERNKTKALGTPALLRTAESTGDPNVRWAVEWTIRKRGLALF